MRNLETVKVIAINMLVTFFQAGIAVWVATGMQLDKASIGAVVGAGLSAVWNTIIKPLLKTQGYMKG